MGKIIKTGLPGAAGTAQRDCGICVPTTALVRVMGIDPGTATVGYGVIDVEPGYATTSVSYGVIRTESSDSDPARLMQIYQDMQELLTHFEPDVVVVEQLFFFRNVTNVMTVSQARGVILLAACQAGACIAEYTPMQVKATITGRGRAEKIEVQETVQELLGLASIPRPDDAADGLALALCHRQFLQAGDTDRVLHR